MAAVDLPTRRISSPHIFSLELLISSTSKVVDPSDLFAQRSLPRPDVHTNLPAARDGQAGMQSPLIAPAVLVQILPKHGIAHDGAERDAVVIGLVAVDKVAPLLVVWRIEHGEIGAAARDIVGGGDVGEKRRLPITAQRRRGVRGRVSEPVGVVVVALALGVLDQLHGLELRPGHIEALEEQGALLDAADHVVALYVGGLRRARLALALGARSVGYG
jgi:hypothetical protein